jgi:UDP-N-acetylglucosamine 2-epimerase
MRVLSAIGARPQFIKAAPTSVALATLGIDEVIVHSGQHYDYGMSQVFFDELGLPEPHLNLGVGSGSHGRQTGLMLDGFERAILRYEPDVVLVHGDTNSTLAAALAAVKLGVRVAHNEAGLRSFNRAMPEEHNRVLTDHCADVLFCPNVLARRQLAREGVRGSIHVVGDVMYDAVLRFSARAGQSQVLHRLQLRPGEYALATMHRSYNVDDLGRLRALVTALGRSECLVILPAHPRLRSRLDAHDVVLPPNVRAIEPVGYLDMLVLEEHSRVVATDSGGVQKEAYFFGVPCVTLRPETEWTETVETGWNVVVDVDVDRIAEAMRRAERPAIRPEIFGNGRAAEQIAEILADS